MADTIDMRCTACGGALTLPAAAAGKRVKCKHCGEIVPVPKVGETKPALKAAKPVAKPVPPPPPPPPPVEDAPIGFAKDEDDDDNPNPYGVVSEENVARCPHCAVELDPPDTKICLNCGYNLETRQRHKSLKVYEITGQDYFEYYLPAIIWVVVLIAFLVLDIVCWMNMEDWMKGGFLDKEEPNPATNRPTFYVGPPCFNVFLTVFVLFLLFLGLRVIIKRFILQPKPPEVEKTKDDEEDEDQDDRDDDDEDEDDEEDDDDEDERPRRRKLR